MPKAALRAIVEGVDGTDGAFCLSTFLALRWLANDGGNPDQVEATIGLIGSRAGLGYNTAAKAVGLLESLGVIAVERRRVPGTRACAPSRFTFPTMRARLTALGDTLPAIEGGFPASGGTLPTASITPHAERYEEGSEEEKRNTRPRRGARSRSFEVDKADECFCALAEVEGSDVQQLTDSGAIGIRVALAEIRRATPAVQPGEIRERAQRYAVVLPSGTRLTARALAKYWARCGVVVGKTDVITVEPEPEGWREWIDQHDPDNRYASSGEMGEATWAGVDPAFRRHLIREMSSITSFPRSDAA